MSAETEPAMDTEERIRPACETTLMASEWEDKDAAVFPPGYPRLCPHEECFGQYLEDEDWADDGTAAFDHAEVTDKLVRASKSSTSRRMHLPHGHNEVEGE